MGIGSRLKHAWSVFTEGNVKQSYSYDLGPSYGSRPDRTRFYATHERTIISSILTRLSIDISSTPISHARLDDRGRYLEDIPSSLNECFKVEANLDQDGRAFRQDLVQSMFDQGVVAVVPVETTFDPARSGSYDIKTLRVGKILQWYPKHVRVELYNQDSGLREEVVVEKKYTAIIENPLYNVMNEPNSTLQRIVRKLNLLDTADEAAGAGKLDLIIQLPYVIKSEARREQAEQRRKDIEFQLKGSQYGIAYTDGTEKITQLNRAAENTLLIQIEYLTKLLYVQLGLTEEVMNGTADEQTMLNYHNRTIYPILEAITGEFKRKFLTKTARTQNQTIFFNRDPFLFVPLANVAEIADKFTRNEILTANEVRQIIGLPPNKDPRAEKLQNSNMPVKDLGLAPDPKQIALPANSNGSSKPQSPPALADQN